MWFILDQHDHTSLGVDVLGHMKKLPTGHIGKTQQMMMISLFQGKRTMGHCLGSFMIWERKREFACVICMFWFSVKNTHTQVFVCDSTCIFAVCYISEDRCQICTVYRVMVPGPWRPQHWILSTLYPHLMSEVKTSANHD